MSRKEFSDRDQTEDQPDSGSHPDQEGGSRSRNPGRNQRQESTPGESEGGVPGDAPSGRGFKLEPRGMSLRTKIVLLVAIVQVIAGGVMFGFSVNTSTSTVEDEIDRSGKQLAFVLAHVGADHYRAMAGGGGPLADLRNRLGERNDEAGEWLQQFRNMQNNFDLSDEQANQLMELSREQFEAVKQTIDRFQSAGSLSDIIGEFSLLGIAITPMEQGSDGTWDWGNALILEHQEGGDMSIGSPTRIEEAEDRNITVSEGQYAGTTVRMYRLERDQGPYDQRVRVRVLLDAAQIDNMFWQVANALLIGLVISIVIGIGAGYLFSGRLTNPIQLLLEDIQTVSEGNLDHRTRPESKDEIGQLARTFDRMTRSLNEAREREIETRALEHELDIARDVQSNLLPEWKPQIQGWDLDAYYRPSKEVGGDYYDFIEIDDDHLGIIVADVSGKGIPGSMVMTMTRAMVRMEATHNISPVETLIKTNDMLAGDIRQGMFVTCMYAVLNRREHTLKVASAGHNPMVLWREEESKIRTVNPNGIALGFDEGPVFERSIEEREISMNTGDRFVIYTDGVVEAMNEEEEGFGDRQFYELIGKFAAKDSSELTRIVVDRVDTFTGGAEQHDDITILTARRTS